MNEIYLDSLKNLGTIRIEMVCLGNICRSPMAAAVLHNKVQDLKSPHISVTSSGTSGWHAGEGAHHNSEATWKAAGYSYQHISRPFSLEIFDQAELILAMDLTNRANILNGARNESDRAKVFMLRSFDPLLTHLNPNSPEADALQVPDPWGEPIQPYREVLAMIESATDGLIHRLAT